tara:strand:- start:146 stop:1240 length:1095 start_codon:yes stop_codon:yes gene_type:complete
MTKAAELAKMGEVLTNSQIGRKNIIINGGMQVAQRATSATGVGDTNDVYPTLDRFAVVRSNTAGRLTMSQSTVTDLEGFSNALKLDVTTADTSIAAGEYFIIQHKIEGFDIQQLKATSTSTRTFTISFYAKSNESRAFNLEARFTNGTNKQAVKTITTGTSWARYTMTVPAASSTQIDNDNSNEMQLNFWLHSGSTYSGGTPSTTLGASSNTARAAGVGSIFASTDNTLEITGIQMEVGSVATPFEHRSFGEELALCQRYYQQYNDDGSNEGYVTVGMINSDRFFGILRYVKTMRAVPTVASTGSAFKVISAANTATSYSIDEAHTPTVDSVRLRTGSNSNLTDGQGATLSWSASGNISLDSEI